MIAGWSTEQQRLDRLAVAGQAFHRQVQRRLVRLVGQALLDFAHRRQLRHHASFVVVQADTQIDLVGPRIDLEGLHQRENRVAGIGIDMFEHSAQLLGIRTVGRTGPSIPAGASEEHHWMCKVGVRRCNAEGYDSMEN